MSTTTRPEELRVGDEMIERACRVLDPEWVEGKDHTPEGEATWDQAEKVVRAAFDGVPLTNYGIGLALQFFDLVICVKENVGGGPFPRAGVYASDGPDGFVQLPHKLDVSWGHKPFRHLKRVAVSQIDCPEQEANDAV